ncbi:MAG: class I SAM-dependent methyltransferase [Acidiferrobacterales bacterium]
MSVDRYEYVSRILKYFGWLQDLLLRNMRKHVVEVFKARKVVSVLDACCGAGTLSVYLRDAGMAVTGVDASVSMLALAREKADGITFIEADLTNLDLKETVDGAVVALSLHEMGEQARSRIWESMKRVTTPGGPLVLVDFVISNRKSLSSKIAWHFIWRDEKNIGRHDPSHFENFKEFMKNGGAKRWLLDQSELIAQERYFLWGNLGVFVVNA